METLDRLRGSLGLVYHPKNEFPMSGWYQDNNDCYENSVNSVPKISKILNDFISGYCCSAAIAFSRNFRCSSVCSSVTSQVT